MATPEDLIEVEGDYQQWLRAKQFAKTKMLREIAYTALKNELDDATLEFKAKVINDQILANYEHAMNKEHKSQLFSLCVSPKPGTSWLQFYGLCEKAMKKKWIKDFLYCYEQRSDEEPYHGWHLHACIARPEGKNPSEIRKEFLSTFKDVIGETKKGQMHAVHLDFRKNEAFTNFSQYILGNKQEDKLPKSRADIAWRASIKLQPYYCGGKYSGPYV